MRNVRKIGRKNSHVFRSTDTQTTRHVFSISLIEIWDQPKYFDMKLKILKSATFLICIFIRGMHSKYSYIIMREIKSSLMHKIYPLEGIWALDKIKKLYSTRCIPGWRGCIIIKQHQVSLKEKHAICELIPEMIIWCNGRDFKQLNITWRKK